jgi:hypothetical protein
MVPERQYAMHTLDQARRSLFLASYHHRQGLLSYQGWLAAQEKLIRRIFHLQGRAGWKFE